MPNLIDKLFRKKLQERNFQPEAGDWAAMNELIDTSMGSSGSGFSLNWFAVIGITLVASIGLYYGVEQLSSDHKSIEKVHNESSIEENLKKENNTHFSTPNNTMTIASGADADANTNASASAKNNYLSQSGDAENTAAFQTNGMSKSEISTTAPQINTNTSHESTGTDINFTNAMLEPTDGQDFNEKANPTTIASKEYKKSSSSPALYAANETPSEYSKDLNKPAKRGSLTYYERGVNMPPNPTESIIVSNELFLSSAPISSFNTLELQTIKPLSRDNENVFKVQNMKAKRSLPLQLSIAAFGELSYVTKNIKGDREFSSLIRLRNDQEKNIFTVGGGLEFQVKYKKIGLSSGFASSNWGENVKYEEQYSSDWEVSSTILTDTTFTEEVIFTIDTLFNPNDSTWYVYIDSSFVTVIDTISTTTIYDSTEVETSLGLNAQNGKTTISYWQIPLYFSYQFDIGDFYLSPGIGVSIGFLKITTGYYMNENIDGLIQINSGYSVMRKTLISGQINLGVGYKLGDKFAIEATPTYRFNLGNAFENSGIIQKYSIFSFQAKLRYYF